MAFSLALASGCNRLEVRVIRNTELLLNFTDPASSKSSPAGSQPDHNRKRPGSTCMLFIR